MKQTNLSSELELFPIVSEVRVVYSPDKRIELRPVVKQASDAYEIILQTWDMDTINLFEQIKVILLTSANRINGVLTVGSGGLQAVVCDPRIIFTAALKTASTAIMLVHNHPTGNLYPSAIDVSLTQKIKTAGQFLDIKLIDHLIISPNGFYSFANDGAL